MIISNVHVLVETFPGSQMLIFNENIFAKQIELFLTLFNLLTKKLTCVSSKITEKFLVAKSCGIAPFFLDYHKISTT